MRASEFTSKNVIKPILKQFIQFTAEYLELPSLPTFQLSNKEFAAKNSTFGQYGNHHITVVTQNRHINDILRTLAHEMVHYHQDINDKINMNSSKNIAYIEAEANTVAGLIMRKWNKQNPELMNLQPINESKYAGKTKAYHIGGYTATKIPEFLKKHIKTSKNGNLYYNQYQDSWYANTFEGEHGIYDFHTFQKAINPYFRVQRVYQPN